MSRILLAVIAAGLLTAGLWGALILLTSYDFFAYSQLLLPDMLVVCFAVLAAYFFWHRPFEDLLAVRWMMARRLRYEIVEEVGSIGQGPPLTINMS